MFWSGCILFLFFGGGCFLFFIFMSCPLRYCSNGTKKDPLKISSMVCICIFKGNMLWKRKSLFLCFRAFVRSVLTNWLVTRLCLKEGSVTPVSGQWMYLLGVFKKKMSSLVFFFQFTVWSEAMFGVCWCKSSGYALYCVLSHTVITSFQAYWV